MKDFQKLTVWQKGHRLSVAICRMTASFPKDELYALTSQTRRAASSIGANIAEGGYRDGDAEFGRFLYIAMGSASEQENHLLLAPDLDFVKVTTAETVGQEITEVKRMLAALIRKLKADR